MKTKFALLCLLLSVTGAAGARAAAPQSTDDILATIAMYEDTRCPNISLVTAFLSDSNAVPVRLRACVALSRMQDTSAVAALSQRLRSDSDMTVRSAAAFALGQCGSRAAFPALKWVFDDTGDPDVRDAIVEALGKIGDPQAVPICVRALTNEDPKIRRDGAIALWRLADKKTAPQLLRSTKDPYPENRAMAIWALEKTVDPKVVIPGLIPIAGDGATMIRSYVARTLGRQGTADALPPLYKLLTDPDVHTRVNAARSLGQVGDSSAAPQLVTALADVHPYVRETAVTALGVLKVSSAGPKLIEMAKDKEPGVRAAVPAALAACLPADDAWKAIQPLLGDKVVRVRGNAVEALGSVNKPEVVALLRKTLTVDAKGKSNFTPLERASAAGALGMLKAKEAKADLLAALDDKDPGIAGSAADALGDFGDAGDDVVNALERAVRANSSAPQPDVAMSALDAIAKLKPKSGGALAIGLGNAQQAALRDHAKRLAVAAYGDSVAAQKLRALPPRPWKPLSIMPYKSPPTLPASAVLKTSRGEIEIRFYTVDAPRTVANFCALARKGYYDHTRIHRLVPNFVVQDGDPTGTGWGGPGYTISCEYNRRRYDVPGVVGMALSGKDTGGSQYFITQSPQPHLDGRYTVFGHIERGIEILDDFRLDDEIEKVTLH